MNKGKFVGVDLDGVVFDFVTDFVKFYNARLGYTDHPDDVVKWDWWECPNLRITKDEFNMVLNEYTRLRMWRDTPIYSDVKSNLCSISLQGVDVIYITCRPKESRRSTVKSILSNGLPFDGIEFVDHTEKAEYAVFRNMSAVIEDKVETVISYAKAGLKTYFRVDNHNRNRVDEVMNALNDEQTNNLVLVDSFREFAEDIRRTLIV